MAPVVSAYPNALTKREVTNMRATRNCLVVLGLIFSTCCWGKERTHLIVASTGGAELRELAMTPGAHAQVITTDGENVLLNLTPGAVDTLHGTSNYSDEREVELPFDSLAL